MTLTAQPRPGATPTDPTLGTIAPGEPVYLYAVNPWLPWVNRVGGAAIGVVLAAAVSILLDSPLRWQAVGAAITAFLMFAWVVAGHELHAKRPRTFKVAP